MTTGQFHTGRIAVVGSLNMDLVVRTSRLPQLGETLAGKSLVQISGGKGGNQAVAASRLGAKVAMLGCVGNDSNGMRLRQELENDDIDCSAVIIEDTLPTGVALIMVDDRSQNAIITVAGSNGALTPAAIPRYETVIAQADVLVCQMEIPAETVFTAMQTARRFGRIVVLNPAPVIAPLPVPWWEQVDFLIPNEVEASVLSGISVNSVESASSAAKKLRQLGVRQVIITLGSQGVYVMSAEDAQGRHYPGNPVQALDTTAAGDTFIGGFCTKLAAKDSVENAVRFGQAAAALSVTRIGAQTSIPYLFEVHNLYPEVTSR